MNLFKIAIGLPVLLLPLVHAARAFEDGSFDMTQKASVAKAEQRQIAQGNSEEISNGMDVALTLPALAKDGEPICLEAESATCPSGTALVVVPDRWVCENEEWFGFGSCQRAYVRIPMQMNYRLYGGFQEQLESGQNANFSITVNPRPNVENVAYLGGIDSELFVGDATAGQHPGHLQLDITNYPNNVPFNDFIPIGELNVELSYQGNTVSREVVLAIPNLSSVSQVDALLQRTSDKWSRGQFVATNWWRTGGGNLPWSELGRIMAWNEARQSWDEEATSELAVRSVVNGIGGFNTALTDVSDVLARADYEIGATPIVLRINAGNRQ